MILRRPLVRSLVAPLTAVRQCVVDATCNTINKSAACRARLSALLSESSVENALSELEYFRANHVVQPSLRQQLIHACTNERVNLLLKEFDTWYFKHRAADRVSLTEPWLWYPRARNMRRSFVFHMGPTNSGKTHDALEALIKSSSGVYCAPLKALASQVYAKINGRGVPCDLLIGDERRFAGSAEHVSCTMEMTPLELQVDVAVIDEIQMISDRERGWAWTRAVLGLPAREIHLCGESRTLSIIQRLLTLTNEHRRLRCVEHKRLVPLTVSQQTLRSQLNRIENGDCLVCFSKKSIFRVVDELQKLGDVRPHVVYGALPFSVREAQSDAFNTGVLSAGVSRERHVLVSTDAIAYGLNMNIRRIVFTTVRKFDGKRSVDLPQSTVLQVAGRAGRFGLAFSSHGYTTTLHERDLPVVQQAFQSTQPDIGTAGILPTAEILLVHVEAVRRSGRPVHLLAPLFESLCSTILTSPCLFVCDTTRSLVTIARALDTVDDMQIKDKIMFCFVPMSDNTRESLELLCTYAHFHTRGQPVAVGFEIPANATLSELEWMYRMCEVYCWLAWRFRATFINLDKGQNLKQEISALIARALTG